MMKGLKIVFYMILIALYYFQNGDGRIVLTINDFIYDAKKSITNDYSQAFQNAWRALCDGKVPNGSKLVIYKNETHTLRPQMFEGPCSSSNIHIQIDGKLQAPNTPKQWNITNQQCWFCFSKVNGLFLTGSGILHTHGETWWSSLGFLNRPTAVSFQNCNNIKYSGITQINSPRNHISLYNCVNATLSNLHLIAPQNSPNTDGINIALSHNIDVYDSTIQTGDDCIAITGGINGVSRNINITGVTCGPGHGISIGSLGKDGTSETVQNVNVKNCIFNETQNGARIKTWAGGQGVARNIVYENITLINANYPIIIDQHYSDGGNYNNSKENAVKVSDITFRHFEGTCTNNIAIKLDCDKSVGCHNIIIDHVNITSSSPGKSLTAYCKYADVRTSLVSIQISCNLEEDLQSHKLNAQFLALSHTPYIV